MAYGGNCSDRTGTNGNISADPLFTDPTHGDYHLQLVSPSIDSGYNQAPNLPDKDLDGDPRIVDGDGDGNAIVDMGVYEFLAPSSAVRDFIPRRPRSFTAKIPIGVGSPNTSSSTSWAIPIQLEWRRILKGSSLWASSRLSARRQPKRFGLPYSIRRLRPPGTIQVCRGWPNSLIRQRLDELLRAAISLEL